MTNRVLRLLGTASKILAMVWRKAQKQKSQTFPVRLLAARAVADCPAAPTLHELKTRAAKKRA